ncbi:MAG TPA: DUF1566 domain-containing protein [Acidobacteriota bacterium]|nr:DUF1566 domain-containing protein [Acidobacteriota bacterium]
MKYFTTIIFTLLTTTAFAHSWDKKIDGPNRFKVLSDFNNEAVLDKETGLVWQKAPLLSERSWFAAWKLCQFSTAGNRAGWRLPTVEELRSLVDPQQSEPALPPQNPFTDVISQAFWSASTGFASTNAMYVEFQSGSPIESDKSLLIANTWCVRGGDGYDTNNP